MAAVAARGTVRRQRGPEIRLCSASRTHPAQSTAAAAARPPELRQQQRGPARGHDCLLVRRGAAGHVDHNVHGVHLELRGRAVAGPEGMGGLLLASLLLRGGNQAAALPGLPSPARPAAAALTPG